MQQVKNLLWDEINDTKYGRNYNSNLKYGSKEKKVNTAEEYSSWGSFDPKCSFLFFTIPAGIAQVSLPLTTENQFPKFILLWKTMVYLKS